MRDTTAWPLATPVTTERLSLEPLSVEHAPEAFLVFDDLRLHRWTGGIPRTLAETEEKYRSWTAGQSPDGRQGWLNWIVRRATDAHVIGTVQATLSHPANGPMNAELAWVVGTEHQNSGYGREGALAAASRLRAHGAGSLTAYIHPQHTASTRIARALGMTPTDTHSEGETLWELRPLTAR